MDKSTFTATEQLRRYRRRIQEQREKEEKYWASMNGPVVVTQKESK